MTDPKPSAEELPKNLIEQYDTQLAAHWENNKGPLTTDRESCEALIAYGIAAGMRQVFREEEDDEEC